MAGLQAITRIEVISGGYPGEAIGAGGGYPNWTDVGNTGSITETYYYTDSDTADNNNSSRVTVTIRDTWTVTSISENNYINLTTHTDVVSIVRGYIVGTPATYGYRRDQFVRQISSGPIFWSLLNDPIDYDHTLSSGFSLGSYSYTIAPGQEIGRGTIYYRGNTEGHDGDTPPSKYIDEYWMGISFRNTLPERYRPGETWNGSSWMSHNRSAGTAKLYDGKNWDVLWTQEGGVGSDDPPLIRSASEWKNMRKIGNE